jgi:hypothetical protein
VRKKGHVTPDETQALLDAGYSRGALFEVVAQVGHTTLANVAHSISCARRRGVRAAGMGGGA